MTERMKSHADMQELEKSFQEHADSENQVPDVLQATVAVNGIATQVEARQSKQVSPEVDHINPDDTTSVPRRTGIMGSQVDIRYVPTRVEDSRGGCSADLFALYLKEIARTPLLTAEQEVEVAKAIEAGVLAEAALYEEAHPMELQKELEALVALGVQAQQTMIKANLRLVVSFAKRYIGQGLPITDLVGEGNIGLIRAVQKFDYTKGNKFSTFAAWSLREAMSRGIADQARTIRIPVEKVGILNNATRAARELEQDLGRQPTVDEIATDLGMDTEQLSELLGIARPPVSLSQPLLAASPGSLREAEASQEDRLEDESIPYAMDDGVAQSVFQVALEIVLQDRDTLSTKEADIIRKRYGIGTHVHTLLEIGKKYNVSGERIRQIENKAREKLAQVATANGWHDYLHAYG